MNRVRQNMDVKADTRCIRYYYLVVTYGHPEAMSKSVM